MNIDERESRVTRSQSSSMLILNWVEKAVREMQLQSCLQRRRRCTQLFDEASTIGRQSTRKSGKIFGLLLTELVDNSGKPDSPPLELGTFQATGIAQDGQDFIV